MSKDTEAKTKESKSKQANKQTNKQLILFWKQQVVVVCNIKFEAGSSKRWGSWKHK